jgi:glycolate oxidase FAD binding subunit
MGEVWAHDLRARLVEALGVEHVLSGDACSRYAVQGLIPELVVRPRAAEEISGVLAAASAAGTTVVPWGGGTRMSLGYRPSSVGLVLSLERLNRVLSHDPADLTVSVETGCTLDQLAGALGAAGQMLPLDAPLPARATIGGVLATGAPGPRRLLYGGPRDLLLGVRAVDAAGTITRAGGRVVKNVTGYDLNKLYVGSLGTLAVLVEASFKLVPVPEAEATLFAIGAEPARALAVAESLAAFPVQPAAVCALSLAGLPGLAARLAAGAGDTVVAARFPGPAVAVERAIREASTAARAAGGQHIGHLEAAAHTAFWSAVGDFPATLDLPADTAVLKVSVLPSELATTLETAAAVAGEHDLRLDWLADAGIGILYLRIQAPARPASTIDTAETLGPGLRALQGTLAHRWRSSVVLACAPELKTGLPLWGADPPAIDVMRTIKRQFDPAGTLNPGRFVGGL